MDLNGWQTNRRKSIVDCVAVVGERSWIDHDGVSIFSGALDCIDDGALMIGLERIELNAERTRTLPPHVFEIDKRSGAIDLGLSGSEEIEVGAVDDEEMHRLSLHGFTGSRKFGHEMGGFERVSKVKGRLVEGDELDWALLGDLVRQGVGEVRCVYRSHICH